MDRRTFLTLPWLAALAGCRDTRAPGDGIPVDQRVVVLFPEQLKGTLDPRLNTRAWPGKLIHLAFDGLTTVNTPSGRPEPALAAAIEQPAPEIYDVRLRPGALFHDGSPVTARDVAATLESVRDKALGSPLRTVHERLRRIETQGADRVRLILEAPHAPYLSDLSVGVLPARYVEGKAPLMGAGPFAIQSRTDSHEVVLARHDRYWRGRPTLPYVVVRAVTDQNTRLLALLGGAADLVQNAVSPRLADAMRSRPGLAVDTFPGTAYSYICFNLRQGPLADVRVRQALAHGIDRQGIIRHKFRGVATAAQGMLPASHWAYAPDQARYPHDPAKAAALLDAAGFPPGPDGVRLTIELKVNTDKFRRNLARVMTADLAKIGVDLQVQAFEVGTLLSDVKSGNFQAYMLQWGDPSEPHFYNWIFHGERVPTPSEPNRGGNRGAYVRPEVSALIDQGRVAPEGERAAIYQQIQRLVAEDLPYLSLWHEDVVVVRRKGLTGYAASPNASLYGLWQARW
ncbi:MAG: ABC transporter substrate-binding protein, partial [Myxococcales bacterium]|nr:ABC transporter substrate-binding protein [Myxococcales bacterium]